MAAAKHKSPPNRSTVESVRSRADLAEQRLRLEKAEAQRRAIARLGKAAGAGGGGRGTFKAAAGSYSNQRGGFGKGRFRSTRRTPGGAADYHMDPGTMRDLRADSQAAMRQWMLARIIVSTLVRMVVGGGPTLKPQTADKDFNARKIALLRAWFASDYEEAVRLGYTGTRMGWGCDVRGLSTGDAMFRQMVRAAVLDGDLLGWMTPGNDDGSGAQMAMAEAERVVGPGGYAAFPKYEPGVGGWISGVEFDGSGRAIRAGVAPWNAGQNQPRFASDQLEYVDLTDGSAFFFRNPIGENLNQTRGEPALAAALPEMERLDDLDDAVLEAAATQAKLTALVTSPSGGILSGSLPGTSVTEETFIPTSSTAGRTSEQRVLEPGTLIDAGTGTDVKTFAPTQPGTQHEPYVMLRWGMIAADLGVPILMALMDPRQTNYSGFRAVIALAQKNFDLWREELSKAIRTVEVFKTAHWIRTGLLPLPTDAEGGRTWSVPSVYVWPPMPMLDPKAEIAAATAMVAGALDSRDNVIMGLTGRDAATVDAERKIERDREETDKLDKPWTIGQAVQPAGGSAGTDGEAGSGQSAVGSGEDGPTTKVGGRFGAHVNGTSNGTH